MRGPDGHVLLDALFALFLAGVMLVATLGVFSALVKNVRLTERAVREELEARSEYSREREVEFSEE
ncbi:MAG TPA: hypothetical protein VMX75_13375 [Spirochaetia bacterium]|nr:hypothetical protein [Spirochaetia bacterium]